MSNLSFLPTGKDYVIRAMTQLKSVLTPNRQAIFFFFLIIVNGIQILPNAPVPEPGPRLL